MVLKFDEYVNRANYEQSIEEGRLRDLTMATAMAAGIMLGSPHLKTDGHKEQPTKIEQMYDSYDEHDFEEWYPSDFILEYIKHAEGWHEGWQDDGKGYPTTGWGFKQTPELLKEYPDGMTEKQADKYFYDYAVPERVEQFKKCVPNFDLYTWQQLDALFDLFYNVGYGTFTKGSPNLQKALKKGDMQLIAQNMDHDYNNKKLPGLRIRRDFERQMFLEGIPEA